VPSSLTQRPGVYSDLEASEVRYSSGKGRTAGLLCLCDAVAPGLYTVASAFAASATFGAYEKITELCSLLLKNGASAVVCSVYDSETTPEEAASAFLTEESAYVLACGSSELAVQTALLSVAAGASAQRREKICVFGMENADIASLTERAAALNSERAVLVGVPSGDGVGAAAAAAGAICAISDVAAPVVDISLEGVTAEGMYSDDDFDALIVGGVTPVEAFGGAVSVSRGVTTRTTTGGSYDTSFRELTTILIADEVIPGIRESLTAMFRRAKNTAATREAIRTQVILELESRILSEIIESYGTVTALADAEDPTLCLVSFDFVVAHGLNRVHLSAIITV